MRLYFSYRGETIHRNTESGHKMRYWCLFSKGGQLVANTQAEIKAAIAEHLGALIYINRLGDGQRETVAQYETRKEARKDVREYRLSDPSANYYISSKPCNHWKD